MMNKLSDSKCGLGLVILILVFLGRGGAQADEIGSVVTNKCTRCDGLNECKVLNGFEVPDRINGYTREATSQLEAQGVCMDMDLKTHSFPMLGKQRQFKETPECQLLVNKFTCLIWAIRDNTCADAPKPPCRSLCVEVAEKCIHPHLYRIYLDNVCSDIPCTQDETNCIPGSNELQAGYDKCTIHQFVAQPGQFSRASWTHPCKTFSFVLATLLVAVFSDIIKANSE